MRMAKLLPLARTHRQRCNIVFLLFLCVGFSLHPRRSPLVSAVDTQHSNSNLAVMNETRAMFGVPPDLLSFVIEPQSSAQLARFKCRDQSAVLPWSVVNDDFCDCKDGSDEPSTSACSHLGSEFFCVNGGYSAAYIPSSRVNDGICDCCDGSDEWNTEASQRARDNIYRHRVQKANGYDDADDPNNLHDDADDPNNLHDAASSLQSGHDSEHRVDTNIFQIEDRSGIVRLTFCPNTCQQRGQDEREAGERRLRLRREGYRMRESKYIPAGKQARRDLEAQIKTLEGELNKLHARGKKRRKRASVLGRKARALKRRDEQAWKEMHNEEVLLTAFRHLDSLSSSGSAGDRGASGEKAEGGQERAGDEMVSLEEIKAYLRINQLAMSTPAAGSTPGAGAGAAQTTESSHDVDADRRGTSDPDHRGFECVYSHKRPSALASLPSGTGDRADPIETLLDQNQDGIVSAYERELNIADFEEVLWPLIKEEFMMACIHHIHHSHEVALQTQNLNQDQTPVPPPRGEEVETGKVVEGTADGDGNGEAGDGQKEGEVGVTGVYVAETLQLMTEKNLVEERFAKSESKKNETMKLWQRAKREESLDLGRDQEFYLLYGRCFVKRTPKYVYKFCPFNEMIQEEIVRTHDEKGEKTNARNKRTSLGKFRAWTESPPSSAAHDGVPNNDDEEGKDSGRDGGEGGGDSEAGMTEEGVSEDEDKDQAYFKARERGQLFHKGARCYKGPLRSTEVRFECGDKDRLLSIEEPEKCAYLVVFATPAVCAPPQAPSASIEAEAQPVAVAA